MKQTNAYIFMYASVMVIVVAAILSFTSEALKPIQQENVKIEKIQNILKSVGIESTKEEAQTMFDKYIPEENRLVIGTDGKIRKGLVAFDLNLKKEMAKPEAERNLPLFIANIDGTQKPIIQLLGKGLWGPIWGYIALNDDYNTIFGATFDHKGETPGLGAEIAKKWFQEPFVGKTIFDKDGNFVSITVHKGGHGAAKAAGDLEHGVDAISGGTITSKSLQRMVNTCLGNYVNYFNNHKKQ